MSAPSRSEPERERHLPGEEGTWILIFGDMTVFAFIFVVYTYDRSQNAALFNASQQALNQNFGAINTLVLLSSSLCVALAVRAVRHDLPDLASRLFGGAFLCALGFASLKCLEYGEKLGHGIGPMTNSFYTYYFVLTGLHFFHLLLGMGVLAFLRTLARKPELTKRQFGYLEGGACFWHMVDLLWIVLFPLLYLMH
jgi:nitric oxide reductase NorE protein